MAAGFTVASLGRQEYQEQGASPQIRAAGLVKRQDESAQGALRWEARPPTPDAQRKYGTQWEAGKIARHHGYADDPIPQGTFGAPNTENDSVAKQMQGHYPTTELGRWQLEQAENIYASSKHEPLGRGYERGTQIPAGMGTERPFGMVIDAKAKSRAGQVKDLVFPNQAPELEEDLTKTHDLYLKSHGAYEPGEQRRRQYNWEQIGVDPSTHRFGAVDADAYRDGVRKALQPALDQSLPGAEMVASKLHADYKLAHSDVLGQVRKLGTGDRTSLEPGHAYGMPSCQLRGGVRPSVEQLLKTGHTVEQNQLDANLGKSLREGWRNIAPENRVFGVPSVRTDVQMPNKRSVTSIINYGNEPDVQQLLRPPKSVERGIHEGHYMELRSAEDIKAVTEEADIVISDEHFAQVFEMAAQADGEVAKCCLDTFFRARHHMLGQTFSRE
mmetsp:Transcript_4493/g.7571  ORF Transcript_4493/g.7571 Transcript_4493/m.7571 type:complete len:442 (+) Transcript_4493:85-1410(+)|eukprot:CAMPEP_0119109668 /NCGR_PEP_ID=MMETSP1180-20130426/21836_1 /TAXON_ID=3052 ORGANISM="Chlamydomonas cf sp, Strain CCMP681" /NCGR_SAMPLE_ID=MMETSP1180 /ASSEMBLY_ACC=CAM_ASM_000741 /LENGTH=441 /DNA_ID=CAMNT_0007095543 /DNA_START=71 /DNA_END=1396 /DNA_ORIENTATION=+